MAIWIVQYAMGKHNVKKMNETLYKKPEKIKRKNERIQSKKRKASQCMCMQLTYKNKAAVYGCAIAAAFLCLTTGFSKNFRTQGEILRRKIV